MPNNKVKIFVLGISGSIGKKVLQRVTHLNTLALKKGDADNYFCVVGVAAKKSYKHIVKAALESPNCSAVLTERAAYKNAQQELSNTRFKGTLFSSITKALEETPYDVLVNALVGSVGLYSTYMALRAGKKVLLANKESLVMGGELLQQNFSTKELTSLLLPIDSEHSAILHLLHLAGNEREVKKIIITASGGPFFNSKEKNPSVEAALAHPNWSMGKKISIDSATMMNKGLEVIEAHYLFNFPYNRIEVLIHPQSLVHSLIETIDGEQYAQIGPAEMGYAIQNALTYPKLSVTGYKPFSLAKIGMLTFFSPDFSKFPLLQLAYNVGERRQTFPAVMNAANEMAVSLFLQKKINFEDINIVVQRAVESHNAFNVNSVDELIMLDRQIKEEVEERALKDF